MATEPSVLGVVAVALVVGLVVAIRTPRPEGRVLIPILAMGFVVVGSVGLGDQLPPRLRLPLFVVAILGCLVWQRLETRRWQARHDPPAQDDQD